MNITKQIRWWRDGGHFNVDLYLKIHAIRKKEGLSTSTHVKGVDCCQNDKGNLNSNQHGHTGPSLFNQKLKQLKQWKRIKK